MEIKALLKKPYTDKDRMIFIVEENHKQGYEIRETETALEAWGFTEEEIAAQEAAHKRAQIIRQLDEIDAKTTRSMRAVLAGTATKADKDYLAELEEQAQQLRKQLTPEESI